MPGRASFKLSASGEVASIHDANGDQIDRVAFPALGTKTSYGRIPDGDGDWTILGTPSPGQPNIDGAPPDGGLIPDSAVTPDSGTGKPDSSTGKADYGTTKPDYGTTKPDTGSSKVDQGMTKDAGAADGVAGD